MKIIEKQLLTIERHKTVQKFIEKSDERNDFEMMKRELVLFGKQEERKELEIEEERIPNNSPKKSNEKICFGSMRNYYVTIIFIEFSPSFGQQN